jgi:translation initiation factor IF-3
MSPFEALKIARGHGLDLVEVAPQANPPVCRIINYGKYLYQLSKRQHEARKNQRSIELKEVKFRPRTSEHDFTTKKNHIIEFLGAGNKVKATIMFRGREMAHREIGWQMMSRLIEDLGEQSQVETRPKQEGPNLTAILAPKKAAGGGKSKPQGAAQAPPRQSAPHPAPGSAAPKASGQPPEPEPVGAKPAASTIARGLKQG